MEFNQLLDDFAKRHNVDNLVVVDGAAALDIDGIIVTLVSNEGVLIGSAEIGEVTPLYPCGQNGLRRQEI